MQADPNHRPGVSQCLAFNLTCHEPVWDESPERRSTASRVRSLVEPTLPKRAFSRLRSSSRTFSRCSFQESSGSNSAWGDERLEFLLAHLFSDGQCMDICPLGVAVQASAVGQVVPDEVGSNSTAAGQKPERSMVEPKIPVKKRAVAARSRVSRIGLLSLNWIAVTFRQAQPDLLKSGWTRTPSPPSRPLGASRDVR